MALLIFFFVSIIITTVCLFEAVKFARAAKKIRIASASQHRTKKYLLEMHEQWITYFQITAIISIALIETAIVKNGGKWGPPLLMYIHLILVFFSVVLFCVIRYNNGRRNPVIHKKHVYDFLYVFILTLTTGLWLLAYHPLLFGN